MGEMCGEVGDMGGEVGMGEMGGEMGGGGWGGGL